MANGDDAPVAATVTLLGPPGSGKGTQATRLRGRLGFEVLSTGDLLREAREAGSDLGRSAASFMDRGELVPDHLIVATVEDAIRRRGDRPIVLDGFPRTVSQARALDRDLASRRLDSAILIDVPDDEVVRRILDRHQGARTTRRRPLASACACTTATPSRWSPTTTSAGCCGASTARATRTPSRTTSARRSSRPQPVPGPGLRAPR